MPELDYVLFDTWQPSNAAAVESLLFQVPRGGDSTHTESFTNMRGAGQLPQSEKFNVSWMGLIMDGLVPEADTQKVFLATFAELIIADFSYIKLPIAMMVAYSAYQGVSLQAAAANFNALSLIGDGLELKKPIEIPGSTQFKFRIVQGTALSAQLNVKVALRGMYTIPGPSA